MDSCVSEDTLLLWVGRVKIDAALLFREIEIIKDETCFIPPTV
jgi:hypothetical protein